MSDFVRILTKMFGWIRHAEEIQTRKLAGSYEAHLRHHEAIIAVLPRAQPKKKKASKGK